MVGTWGGGWWQTCPAVSTTAVVQIRSNPKRRDAGDQSVHYTRLKERSLVVPAGFPHYRLLGLLRQRCKDLHCPSREVGTGFQPAWGSSGHLSLPYSNISGP